MQTEHPGHRARGRGCKPTSRGGRHDGWPMKRCAREASPGEKMSRRRRPDRKRGASADSTFIHPRAGTSRATMPRGWPSWWSPLKSRHTSTETGEHPVTGACRAGERVLGHPCVSGPSVSAVPRASVARALLSVGPRTVYNPCSRGHVTARRTIVNGQYRSASPPESFRRKTRVPGRSHPCLVRGAVCLRPPPAARLRRPTRSSWVPHLTHLLDY